MSSEVLVRYGAIPEVGRFSFDVEIESAPKRGAIVVIESHRGLELGTLLEAVRKPAASVNGTNGFHADDEPASQVLREATAEDRETHARLRTDAQGIYGDWQDRIRNWGLELELLDLEWTLDQQKLILYVLTDRGADTTKLALQAAAEGLTAIEVQPVSADGVVALPSGGGGGCGSGGCGCHE